MFEEDSYELEKECFRCFENEKAFSRAHQFLHSLVKRLYHSKECDLAQIESDLDELCYMFQVDVPQGEMQVQKKTEIPSYLADWFAHHTHYLSYKRS